VHNITIGIDESGSFAMSVRQGRSFTMVAVVMPDYRKFEKIAAELPKVKSGIAKSSDVGTNTRKQILMRVSESTSGIYLSSHRKSEMTISTAADKAAQYSKQVEELLDVVFSNHWGPTFDILFDSNSLITQEREKEFIEMCYFVATAHCKNIDWIEMMSSKTNRVLQVIDFPANVIGESIEHAGEEHDSHEERKIIEKK
jgi:hypothetical protein